MAVVPISRLAATPSDDVLLARFSAGDRSALNELFHRHRTVAYRVAYRLLGNEADALDAVQDGFVNALRHLNRFGQRSSFRTWLLRVVSNAALDIGRQRARRDIRSEVPLSGAQFRDSLEVSDPPDLLLERADLRKKIDHAIAQLSVAHRQTFVLHAEGGLTYQEISESLRISVGTVMSRIFYARQRLKAALSDQVLT